MGRAYGPPRRTATRPDAGNRTPPRYVDDVPLVSDFTDVLQLFANSDLLPATYERAAVPTYVLGKPTSLAYVDQGSLPANETFIVPSTQDEDAERDDLFPAGDRARARIAVFTSVQLRAGRNPNDRADVVVTSDGRRWRVVKAMDWQASGNFWHVECELLDGDPS